MMRAREIENEFELGKFPPLADLPPASERFKNPPPPRDYLLKDVLPTKVIGGLIATGGVGKGYLMIMLGLAMATGKKIGPLEPTRKFKVLYLAGEDDQDELDRRMICTAGQIWPEGPPEEIDNFIARSVNGKNLGPLMRLDEAGNQVYASAYDWLCNTLEKFKDVDVLILDPKSKFYGLDENNNGHNAAWIDCLESLVAGFRITILFCHHESKATAGNMNQLSSRGGSALTDGCRWVANIKMMDEKTVKNFKVPDPYNYVVLEVTKSNYAPKLQAPIYFRRGAGGALTYVEFATEKVRKIANMLLGHLSKEQAEGRHYSKRDLQYEKEVKPIISAIKEIVQQFERVNDIKQAVDYLLEAGQLEEVQKREAKTGPKKTILRVITTTG